MEKRDYAFPAGQPAAGRALAGVVGSGDLEVLLQPGSDGKPAAELSGRFVAFAKW